MDDLISRSDAIGAVKEERFPIDSDYAEGFMAALDKVEWILKEWLPSAQPDMSEYSDKLWRNAYERGRAEAQQRWIPCSERLPEEDGDYWVTADPRYVPPGYRSTDVITWRGGKWVTADYFVLDSEGRKKPEFKVVELAVPIIAWMPLPEPYREGDC